MPSVTVVTPFLDPPVQFFEEAIESVRRQTLADWELILVDDGSAAPACDVASRAARADARIRVVPSPGRGTSGSSAARNSGIAASRGDVVAFLDADDRYEPTRLERHVAVLRRHPHVALVCGDTLYWRRWPGAPDGGDDFVPRIAVPPGIVEPPRLLVSILAGRGAVPCVCSLTVRRRAVERTGGFDASFRSAYDDQIFLARICGQFPVYYLGEALERYRIHEGSITAGTSRPGGAGIRRRFLDQVQREAVSGLTPADRERVLSVLRRARWELDHPVLAGIRRRMRKLVGRAPGEG